MQTPTDRESTLYASYASYMLLTSGDPVNKCPPKLPSINSLAGASLMESSHFPVVPLEIRVTFMSGLPIFLLRFTFPSMSILSIDSGILIM